jgi:hypothetical protein
VVDLQRLNAGCAEHRVEGRAELGVAIPDQKPEPGRSVTKLHQQVAGGLHDPVSGRVGGDPGQVHPAMLVLDDEQRIQLAQPLGVHGEEVHGQRPRRLRAQELHPARTAAPRGPAQSVSAQDPAHSGRGHRQCEFAAFADKPRYRPGAPEQVVEHLPRAARSGTPPRLGGLIGWSGRLVPDGHRAQRPGQAL